MEVLVFNEQKDLAIDPHSVRHLVEEVISFEGCKTDEVSVYFVTTEKISLLHQEFFQDPSPTDCISFPMDQENKSPYHILGEIFVCPKTAIDYLLKMSEEISEDPYLETTLYVVHGLLHLMGYEDISEADIKKMRAAEKRHLNHLIAKKIGVQN